MLSTRTPSKYLLIAFVLGTAFVVAPEARAQVAELRAAYVSAVKRVNEEHARKPGKTQEADLAKRLPKAARAALEKLLAAKDAPRGAQDLAPALVECGEAALDLDLADDFAKVRTRLEKASPERARELGTALSKPRFLLRGIGGLDETYLEKFAELLDAVLAAYDEVFGFKEWSKVPGKKLRVRLHLEEKIKRPPHFAPEHPFHSEVDFPVIDAKAFRSPTADGQFLFYGLCHELGHVIAMWGDPKNEEDHHAWAHYTGIAIVEHLAAKGADLAFMKDLRDVRWRSLAVEKENLKGKPPSLKDRDGVLALLLKLHDEAGPRALGDAINVLDSRNPIEKRQRFEHVRYYGFKEFRAALLGSIKDARKRKAVEGIFPE